MTTESKSLSRPPLHTLLTEIVGWTMDRTADIPKSQRFTLGQRLDNLTLDALMHVTRAVFSGQPKVKVQNLDETLLLLEQMQVLWRLVNDRRWISQQQLLFVNTKLAEAGRMANGWRQQQTRKEAAR